MLMSSPGFFSMYLFYLYFCWHLSDQELNFCRVVVQGPGPGPRYGHVMALVGQRYLMAIGGNDGMLALLYCAC